MRLLRITFLQTYLTVLNKNKKKALFLINIGIFFTIFALSSASISFFIEKKISDYQNELLILQMDSKSASNMISGLENSLNNYDLILENERYFRREKQFFSYTELGSKTFTQQDFYFSFNYVSGQSFKEYETMFKKFEYNPFDIKNKQNQEIIKRLKEGWNENEVDEYVSLMLAANTYFQDVLKIDFEKYNIKKIPSLEEVKEDILNKNNHIWFDSSEYEDDYYKILNFEQASKDYYQAMLKAVKGDAASVRDNINELNKIIIELSKQERNIIIITFLLQFIVFMIIQFFEINSLNFNFKKKINEKKIR